MVQVSDLYIYPLKSARGIAVSALEFDAHGPIGDRRWMLIDENARFLSQRRIARMALLQVALGPGSLTVDAPGMSSLTVAIEAGPAARGERLAAGLFEDTVTVRRVSADADRWFSEALRRPCSLVTMPEDVERVVDPTYAPPARTVALADAFPVLVIGQGSLDEMNRRLRAKGIAAVGINRFRPNVVVSGAAPHAEDQWRRLIGPGIALDLVKPCARCAIPAVDPDRGTRGVEPLKTLNEYRRRDSKVFFGQNALHDRPGRLAVGEVMRAAARTGRESRNTESRT